MRGTHSGATLLAALCLAGCLGGLKNETPQPTSYRIDAPQLPQGPPLAADLLVTVEAMAPGLEGTGIAGRFPGSRIDYFAGARWPVRGANLVESALLEALQNSGRLRSVQGSVAQFRSTHAIAIEVRRFEADYTRGEPPVAQVGLAVTVGRQADRRVLAAFAVAAEEKTAANRVSAVVEALDAAFARAATDVAARSLEAIAADLANQNNAQAP